MPNLNLDQETLGKLNLQAGELETFIERCTRSGLGNAPTEREFKSFLDPNTNINELKRIGDKIKEFLHPSDTLMDNLNARDIENPAFNKLYGGEQKNLEDLRTRLFHAVEIRLNIARLNQASGDYEIAAPADDGVEQGIPNFPPPPYAAPTGPVGPVTSAVPPPGAAPQDTSAAPQGTSGSAQPNAAAQAAADKAKKDAELKAAQLAAAKAARAAHHKKR